MLSLKISNGVTFNVKFPGIGGSEFSSVFSRGRQPFWNRVPILCVCNIPRANILSQGCLKMIIGNLRTQKIFHFPLPHVPKITLTSKDLYVLYFQRQYVLHWKGHRVPSVACVSRVANTCSISCQYVIGSSCFRVQRSTPCWGSGFFNIFL